MKNNVHRPPQSIEKEIEKETKKKRPSTASTAHIYTHMKTL
jgi:hypothetical protein